MKEIRKIIELYDATDHSNEQLALASVVQVEASSYRRIGARMLVSSSGHWVGGISGGCLEGDALKRSRKAIFSNKASTVVYDTMDDDNNEIGIGLGCNGRIEVLFTPIDPNDNHNPIEQLRKVAQSKSASILLKAVGGLNSDSHLGLSTLINEVDEDFSFCGIHSGTLKNAIEGVKKSRRPAIFSFEPSESESLNVLVEYIRPETQLVIIGDNYDVSALVGIANEIGWECHIVGRRKKISKQLFDAAKAVYEYEDFEQLDLHEYTAVVLMTHDYNWDKKILPQVIHKELPYIGMLGPKKRMLKMQEELNLEALDDISYFFSPVGLDIGAESPEEIALAIAAEIVAAFRKKAGKSLKYKKGVIHDD